MRRMPKRVRKNPIIKQKKQIEEAKIKRIRESDKAKQKELEEKLTKEVEEKKKED